MIMNTTLIYGVTYAVLIIALAAAIAGVIRAAGE